MVSMALGLCENMTICNNIITKDHVYLSLTLSSFPFLQNLISVPFLYRQLHLSSYHISLFWETSKYRKVILNRENHKSAFAPPSVLCNLPSFPTPNPTSLAQLLTSFSALESSFLTLSPLAP